MPSLCRTKHNRAKPMFELPSAIFLIADGNEFRFARFYIVCEEVPLGTPESPLIVCSLSDTLRECPNVAKTRNGMPDVAWKKYTNFASKNLPPSVLSGTFRYRFFRISLIPILFRYGWRLRGRAGSDAASAGCAALRLARCMPPVMWESAGAASSASIKQARLMESSP